MKSQNKKKSKLLEKLLVGPIAKTFECCYKVYKEEMENNNMKPLDQEEFIQKASRTIREEKECK